jgi:Tol biopolymer transport system component
MFEMLSGQVPFGGDTPMAVMTKITTTPPPDLRKLRAEVPYGLIRIISKMLTREKRRRYQTMREVAVDLEREQQALVPHARRGGVDIYQQIAARILILRKGSDAVFSKSRSALSSFVSRMGNGARKLSPKFMIATLLLVAIAVAGVVFFPSLMSRLDTLQLSQGTGSPPAISSVNRSVVFSASSAAGEIDFYVYEMATAKFTITNPGGGKNWGPVLGPTGAIYYTSIVNGKAEIHRRLPDGKIEQVTDTPGDYQSWGPVFSLLGNLYFTSNRGDGRAEIYRMIDGKTEQVTDTPGDFQSWGPALSALGNLYFTSNRADGKAEIFRVINGKTEPVTDTPGPFESWGPALSELGSLYFTSNRGDGKAEIYRLTNGKTEQVTDTPGDFQSWGAVINGLNVYFTSNRSGGNTVYQLSPNRKVLNIESWTIYNLDERSPVYPLP